jgi:hypothetical protein
MPLPQPHDFKIAEADQLAQSVMALLRGLSWGHRGNIKPLRERLEEFSAIVTEVADDLADAE